MDQHARNSSALKTAKGSSQKEKESQSYSQLTTAQKPTKVYSDINFSARSRPNLK